MADDRTPAEAQRSVLRLTVRLTGVMPIVWRTILVRPEARLSNLHRYIQAAMGWQDYHLFEFKIDGKYYGVLNGDDADRKVYDARRCSLARLFPAVPARFEYVYDFGDYWEHIVEIERVQPAKPGRAYPRCIAGGEPCPPEDCGGPEGYRILRAILKNPHHPGFAESTAWAESQRYRTWFDRRVATLEMLNARDET